MSVERKTIETNVSGKVISITRNEKQDYYNKAASSKMKAWNVKIENKEEAYVYHSKGEDSNPVMKEGETINYDLKDVVSDKGHWYYQMSVKSDFSSKKYVNPDLNKMRIKISCFRLTNLTIDYFSKVKEKDSDNYIINPLDLSLRKYMDIFEAIYHFCTGYDKKTNIYSHESDYYYMELRASAFEYVLNDNYLWGKMYNMKTVLDNAKLMLAETESK